MATGKRSVILDGGELALCQKIAADSGNFYQKRAIALLALNDGKSRREAAEISGLSPGQVKYIAAKFLKIRTNILYVARPEKGKVETENLMESMSKTGSMEVAERDEPDSGEMEVEKQSSEEMEAKAKKEKKDKKKIGKKKSDKKKKAKKEKKEKKNKREKQKEKSKTLKKDKEKKKKSGKVKKAKNSQQLI